MYCIYCGGVADGLHTLHCSRCGRTHYLTSKVSASTLTIADAQYLVVKRARDPEKGKWDLPGGFCEYGEDPQDTARRETFEETGLEVVTKRLLGLWMDEYLEPHGRRWPTINLIYAAGLAEPRDVHHALHIGSGTEIAALSWVPLDSPPDDVAFPNQQLGAIRAFRELREPRTRS